MAVVFTQLSSTEIVLSRQRRAASPVAAAEYLHVAAILPHCRASWTGVTHAGSREVQKCA